MEKVDSSKGRVTPFVLPPGAASPRVSADGDTTAGINTGTGADWFGPLNPLKPTAPPEVAGRQLDYPSGYNLNITPKTYEGVPFPLLRAFADSFDVLRIVIETRKDQMERLAWHIVPKNPKLPKAGTGEQTQPEDKRIEALQAFFAYPDREHSWKKWLRMLLEDVFVVDAPTLYRRPTRGGALYALEPIDGATIKRVIDDWGRTPMPPAPAYQQILKGMPAVNYTIRDLYYLPRNPRTSRIYGYSPVEQIMATVNIALRRQQSTLQYYTEGNVPEALIGVPDSWTPEQIAAFQSYWDSFMEGNTAQRRHAKFVPAGVGKTYVETREPELKNVFDEWLARVVCFAFSISPTPFVAQVNRAVADSSKEQSAEDGLVPLQLWVKELIDGVLVNDFGVTDLEFAWAEDDETDPKTAAEIEDLRLKNGTLTIDEVRARRGEQPFGGNAAQPQVLTVSGYVPLDAYEQAQKAKEDAAAVMAEAVANAPAGGEEGDAEAGGKGKGGNPPPGAKGKPGEGAKAEAEGVGKAAAAPFVKAAPKKPPYPRATTRKATTSMAEAFRVAFEAQGEAAGAAIAGADIKGLLAGATGEPDKSAIAALVAKMGLDGPDMSVIEEAYAMVAGETGGLALAQVYTGAAEVFDSVNETAADWAGRESAQLVTAIDETTRSQIQAAIAEGLAAGETADEVAARIEALGSFSPERAELIAYTEIAAANSEGALIGYRAARAQGVRVKKYWNLGENPCDECLENNAAGAIELDEPFPSGDQAPPAHPGCECDIEPVVEETDDGEEGDEDGGGED